MLVIRESVSELVLLNKKKVQQGDHLSKEKRR